MAKVLSFQKGREFSPEAILSITTGKAMVSDWRQILDLIAHMVDQDIPILIVPMAAQLCRDEIFRQYPDFRLIEYQMGPTSSDPESLHETAGSWEEWLDIRKKFLRQSYWILPLQKSRLEDLEQASTSVGRPCRMVSERLDQQEGKDYD